MRKAPPIWVTELSRLDDPLIADVLAIYRESFPPEERITEEALLGCVGAGSGGAGGFYQQTHLLAATNGVNALGMCHFTGFWGGEDDNRSDFVYMDYIAVDKRIRGSGIGGQMYFSALAQAHVDACFRGRRLRGLVYEVERPELAADEEDRTLRQRRIKFYERRGARVLDGIDFVQPSLGEGLPEVPLHLVYHPDGDRSWDPQAICGMIYSRVYGIAADHPLAIRATAG